MAAAHPTSFLSLPTELRQQIYANLLEDLYITPADSLFTLPPNQPIRSITYAHPNLAILQTCRQIHSEALPIFTSTATLSLRHWAQHHLLTQSSNRVPHITAIARLRLSPNLIGRGYYDAITLNTAFDALHHLTIAPLSLAVPHNHLVRLDARREILSGSSEDIQLGSNLSTARPQNGQNAGLNKLDLILTLMCHLNTDVSERVLSLLAAGQERGWTVNVGFQVTCASAGRLLLPGEEQSRHLCSCPEGIEIGFELVGKGACAR
ncbi:uncharacterized protein AB675_9557 [Cyphellophora attinorum]|uniref:F-box domain-containing protein n=1 Tax=Cyphellophora attinorum TaxID=1664694 RepID=A0A0N1HTR6_9EURO|nr:uncharacterized protein AB675_9557 [Phialophora attinorum]KPI42527.1 hypothetical protein AB675_9557 [Phialophora attinorum]